ncbi:MAG: hypothetical protein IJD31_05495 [Lachnospiraceae bacterium]|nr:hypothetical protein [Lachnospiraceae bacterium]
MSGFAAGASSATDVRDGAEGIGTSEEAPHPVSENDNRMAESTYAVFI